MGQPTAAGIPQIREAEAEWSVEAARSVTALKLIDGMLHDVRNPLNALSINLDVLMEKLRAEQGEIHPSQAKNLKVMRDQIHRVDAILKQFSDFISPRVDAEYAPVDLSETTAKALGVVGHELRRAMIRIRQMIEPDLRIASLDAGAVRFLALHILFRALTRAGAGGELDVTLQREGGMAVLRVRDSHPGASEPFEHSIPAFERVCSDLGAEVVRGGPEFVVTMPLAGEG